MRRQFALLTVVVTGAVLIAAPRIENAAPRNDAAQRNDATQRNDKADVIRQLAVRVGHVLGAASGCREVSRPRIKVITDKITEVIKASTLNQNDVTSILQTFDQSVAE